MRKWIAILMGSMLCTTAVFADWGSIDTWDMNGNAQWQSSDYGLNLGGHYASNNQQVAQVADDGTFVFSQTTASGFGGKTALSSTNDLTEGVIRLSWAYSSMNWSNTPAANNQVGFRIYNAAKSEYVGIAFADNNDKIWAYTKSSAGLGNINYKAGRVINSLEDSVTPRTVYLELDYANSEVRMYADSWEWNNGFDVHTNTVDFAAAGVTDIGSFQTYHQNWGAGDQTVFDELAVQKFVIPPEVEILEEWTYTGAANGTNLQDQAEVKSDTGTGSHWGNGSLASVSNEMQYFEATGVANESYFTTTVGGTYEDAATGIYEMSFDVVSADFSNTAVSNATAQVGYGIRSQVGGNKDARVLFRYNGSAANDRFDLTLTSDTGNKTVADIVSGHVLGTNLHIRMVYDMDNKGSLGSYQVFTTLGSEDEVEQYANQLQLEANFQIDQLRLQAQALNGGNGWLPGDGVFIDNIVLSKFNPPDVVHTNVYIVDQEGFSTTNGVYTNFTTLGVLAGDVIAVMAASNKGSEPTTNSVTFSGTASLDAVSYDKRSHAASAHYWTTTVLTDGDVDVEMITPEGLIKSSVYQLRAPEGEKVVLLDTDKDGAPGVESVTNNYALGAVSSGILLEAVSTYGADSTPLNSETVLDSGDANKRNTSHTPFIAVSSIESIWTNSVGNTAIIGLAYSSSLIVPGPETPTEWYDAWAADYPSLTQTGLGDDQDGDLLDNLGEYAFGGDPTLDSDQGNYPTQSQAVDGGTNYLQYVYFERTDAAARGLSSILEVGTDLVFTNWTSTGIEFVGSGPSAVFGYNAVTNRISTDDDVQRFMNLKIEFMP